MNYFIYNNLTIPFININNYTIQNKKISLEITLSIDNEIFNIWEELRQNLNFIFYLYSNNFNISFVLKECYLNNNILILKGDMI